MLHLLIAHGISLINFIDGAFLTHSMCYSLQRRTNIQDLDNEAVAFQSVLGSMLARIYNNPQSKDDNQNRLEKILQFWGSKEVYDQETIANLEREMKGGASYPSAPRHVSPDPVTYTGFPYPTLLLKHTILSSCS
jgi:hypothetical protein